MLRAILGRCWPRQNALDWISLVLKKRTTTCDEYQSVLCAVAAKKAIIGRNYTSDLSDQLWPDWYQVSARLVDPDRLPIQSCATLTISQEYFRDTLGDPEFFTVTDELPTAISMNVNVVYGDASTLKLFLLRPISLGQLRRQETTSMNGPSPQLISFLAGCRSILPGTLKFVAVSRYRVAQATKR